MNKPSIALALLIFYLCGGCATSPPFQPNEKPSQHLVQLNDDYWLDISDVREAIFYRPNPANHGDTYLIQIWHRGATETFAFAFSDQAAANSAWKILTASLGGSLHDDHWKAESSPMAAVPVVAPPPNQYTELQHATEQIAVCRDQHLITADEFERLHEAAIAQFNNQLSNGTSYSSGYANMQTDLAQLESAKKDNLVTAEQAGKLRATILRRYGLQPE